MKITDQKKFRIIDFYFYGKYDETTDFYEALTKDVKCSKSYAQKVINKHIKINGPSRLTAAVMLLKGMSACFGTEYVPFFDENIQTNNKEIK